MKEKLSACYERLQTLSMTATKGNMETMLQVLYDLQEIYQELERMGTDGAETDPGGRDDD